MDAFLILMANSIFLLSLAIVMFIIFLIKSVPKRNAKFQKADLKRIKEEINDGNYL